MPEEETTIKKLSDEKKALEDKVKNLAKIIEVTSQQKGDSETKIVNASEENLKTHFSDLKKSLNSAIRKIEDAGKSKPKEAEMQQKMAATVTAMEEKVKVLEKLPALEEKVKKFEDIFDPKNEGKGLFGGFQKIADSPKVLEIEKKVSAMTEDLDEMRDELITKVTDFDRKWESLMSRMDSRTIRKMEKLMSSQEDIEALIHLDVKEEMNNILSTFSFDIKNLSEDVRELIKESGKVNSDIEFAYTESKNLKRDMDDLKNIINTSERPKLNKLEAKISSIKAGIEDLRNDFTAKISDIDRKQSYLVTKDDVQIATEGLEKRINEMGRVLNDIEKVSGIPKISELGNKAVLLQNEISAIRNDLVLKSADFDRKQASLISKEDSVRILNEMNELQALFKAQTPKVSGIETGMAEMDKKFGSIRDEINAMNLLIDKNRSQTITKEEALKITKDLGELQQIVKIGEAPKIEELITSYTTLHQEFDIFRGDITSSMTDLEKRQLNTLSKDEFSKVQHDLESLKQETTAKMNDIEKTQLSVISKDESSNIRRSIGELQQLIKVTEAPKIKDLENRLAVLQKNFDLLGRDISNKVSIFDKERNTIMHKTEAYKDINSLGQRLGVLEKGFGEFQRTSSAASLTNKLGIMQKQFDNLYREMTEKASLFEKEKNNMIGKDEALRDINSLQQRMNIIEKIFTDFQRASGAVKVGELEGKIANMQKNLNGAVDNFNAKVFEYDKKQAFSLSKEDMESVRQEMTEINNKLHDLERKYSDSELGHAKDLETSIGTLQKEMLELKNEFALNKGLTISKDDALTIKQTMTDLENMVKGTEAGKIKKVESDVNLIKTEINGLRDNIANKIREIADKMGSDISKSDIETMRLSVDDVNKKINIIEQGLAKFIRGNFSDKKP